MRMNTRASGPNGSPLNVLVFGAVLLAVVTIVLMVGADVASEFAEGINANQSEFEQAEENITTVCNGVFGCGEQNPLNMLSGLVAIAVGLFVLIQVVAFCTGRDSPPRTDDSPDKVTLIKQRYMDDEIRTTVKLEKELEEHVDPFLDDSDVQEIDELLDNGDDTE